MDGVSSISFQTILRTALADYSKQVGIDLAAHPLTDRFQSCGSPDDVLKLLEDKAKEFKDFRDGNRKLLDWLHPVVQVVHTLSAVLGTSLTLVGGIPLCHVCFFYHQVLFPGSVPTSKGDLCWSGCPHRSTYLTKLPSIMAS